MGNGQNCGSFTPWETEHGADDNKDRNDTQIQMVAASFFEFVFLTVDDYNRYLLVHENEDGSE